MLIIAAVLIRNGLDDNSSSTTDGTDKPSGGKVTVICSTEFEAICNRLDAKKYDTTTESAGKTLDRLAKADAKLPNAWITLDPFPNMIDVMRGGNGATAVNPTVVAVATNTPLLAIAQSFVEPIKVLCGGAGVTWKCVGGNAGQSLSGGRKLLPGITDPNTEADGLLAFANAVSSYIGVTTSDRSQWEDPAFVKWLRSFRTNVTVTVEGEDPLSTVIVHKTRFNVTQTTASDAAGSAQPNAFATTPTSPANQYVAVVATFTDRAGDLAAKVTASLVTAGWTQATDPQAKLPAGTFIALRTLWKGK